MRRLLGAAVLVPVLVSACGVSAEDAPTLIEESTQERPAATPSFDTVTSPAPTESSTGSSSESSPGSSSAPPTPSPTT